MDPATEAKLLAFTSLCTTDRDRIVSLSEGWELLQEAGVEVLARLLNEGLEKQRGALFSNKAYAALFTLSYIMSSQAQSLAGDLYERHRQAHVGYLEKYVLPALSERHEEFLVREFVRRWKDHKIFTRWLWKFFFHLDRSFAPNDGLPSLTTVGLRAFNDLVFRGVRDHLRGTMLQLINAQRSGEVVDLEVVREAAQVMHWMGVAVNENSLASIDALEKRSIVPADLQFYRDYFEEYFVNESVAYYERAAQQWMVLSTPEYMLKAEQAFESERTLVQRDLHPQTWEKLQPKLVRTLLVENQVELLSREASGIGALVAAKRWDDVGRINRLYKPIAGAIEPIATLIGKQVENEVRRRRLRAAGRVGVLCAGSL